MVERMTFHHFLSGKTVWQKCRLCIHTHRHSYNDTAMLTAKQFVARTKYSFIASPLSLCMHHRVLTNTHTQALFCTLCACMCLCLHGNQPQQLYSKAESKCQRLTMSNGTKGERFVHVHTCFLLYLCEYVLYVHRCVCVWVV